MGVWLNPYLLQKQWQWMMRQPLDRESLPPTAQALVLVSTTVPHKLLYAWQLLQAGYTVVPYFMDDWLANNTTRWRGDNLQQIAKDILSAAPAWLMISEALTDAFVQRYQLEAKPYLVVHNPSPDVQLAVRNWQPAEPSSALGQYEVGGAGIRTSASPSASSSPSNLRLIYAGSIWPMHADALIAVAKAIHLLHAGGHTQYALHIHTSPAHWANYASALQGPGVRFLGWVPYAQLQRALAPAWLLLCTASFETSCHPLTNSSVQTKLTDYLAVGKPTLFVGPSIAASGVFTEVHDTGFTISTNRPDNIAEMLLAIAQMPVQYQRKSTNAIALATGRFSKRVVQEKVYRFLNEVVGVDPFDGHVV